MPFDRMSIDPKVCHGQACVTGTRIPVHQVVRVLANGDTAEDLLSEYPSLTREDIMASWTTPLSLRKSRSHRSRLPANRA